MLISVCFSFFYLVAVNACSALYGNVVPTVPDPKAPDSYQIQFNTNVEGKPIVINVNRSWAPIGADHLYWVVKDGFYDCSVRMLCFFW